MSDEELAEIERKLENDDHWCEWIDGIRHSDVVDMGFDLLYEVKRLREELAATKQAYVALQVQQATGGDES